MTFRALADSVLVDGGVALAYLPSPPQGVWQVGPFPVRAYALCIVLGIVVAIWWGERRWRERGGHPGAILDVAMFAVPFGLIGGRLYHVATDWQKYFGDGGNPVDALKVYQGGLGIWGAVLLGGVGAWIGCRVYRIPLPALGDAVAAPILLAQAIGRLGNYFNQELYGRETDLPWGLQIFRRVGDDGRLDMMNGTSTGVVDKIVHPTFLYEMLWSLFVVIALVYVDKRWRIGHGRLFALYVAGYCFGRFFVELMRADEATRIAGIRINSFTSAVVFAVAIAYAVFATKGRESPAQLQPGASPRPWPWQIGALRTASATAAVNSAGLDGPEGARAKDSEIAVAESRSSDAERAAAGPNRHPEGGPAESRGSESGDAGEAEHMDQEVDAGAISPEQPESSRH
ncbi:prolipoprotein diacylglyceryl transferase [Nocardia sp. CNY236]|uniref:prolipoprotein diacylglyceryl transferase n=1 Tax=Nocardia sp. CNY236 TaxID=1169152 RepID=UPI000409C1C6|nr:prolipoprotein diacylglyceryl transferase [Nocardia sp. CNY236]